MRYIIPSKYRGQFATGAFLLATVLLTPAMAISGFAHQPGDLDRPVPSAYVQ